MSLIFTTVLAVSFVQGPKTIKLDAAKPITTSVKVAKGVYGIPTPAPYDEKKDGSIRIVGNNITVDFQGATLQGSPLKTEPDQRAGTGIFVSGKNITILNAKVRGYKIGLQARNSPGLKIVNCDFSYNWKQHLTSTLEREGDGDWMSYHHNEKDEWLRYGAGIYLRKCDGFEVRGTTIQGGQCGLMLMESNKGKVWNSDFSFLSAIGLGVYMSSDNVFMHNKIDWCLRGFSYGVYNRGQDSAGILIYEQSDRNVFAYNSVTHGGDGFFLWAGQTTMDTGKGGCNDNLLYGNDFSHAPTNGIEATFSRNNFINNLILECWHGVWGGYSYETKIIGNVFGYNAEGIAIEHGQDNVIRANRFHRDNEAIYLWFNDRPQDPNWGYPKHRDTRSRTYDISGNEITDARNNAFRINNSLKIAIRNNLVYSPGKVLDISGPKSEDVSFNGNTITAPKATLDALPGANASANTLKEGRGPLPPASSLNQGDTSDYAKRFHLPWLPAPGLRAPANWQTGVTVPKEAAAFAPKPLKGGMNPFLKADALRGWRYMMVDEWGPYDFKSPLLWPRETLAGSGDVTVRRYEVLGPKGKWRVVSVAGGGKISAQSGTVPGFVEITLPKGKPGLTKIELEYIGAETTDYRGIVTPAGKPVKFGYEKFFAPIDWTIKFFKWKESENAAEVHANPKASSFAEIIAGTPLKELKSDKLDFAGYAFDRVTGNDHYAIVAEGTFEVPAGTYTLELTTDDGARVWLDGKPLIEDAWKYQGPTVYTREVKLNGKHRLRVEHFQIDGYAALKLNLRPKS